MSKKQIWAFLIVCLVVCLLPSLATLAFPTNRTTENKKMAAAPVLQTEDGKLNPAFFDEFENWFNEHIAFRNLLVSADAHIQALVFDESSVDRVVVGTDGWLYYASTLDDYLGRDVLSERDRFNLAHNFELIQDYLQQRGIEFVLTVPPNKNTLYGEHMPYYDNSPVNPEHSAKLLLPGLEARDVNYLDLFALFEAQDEVLYQKTDSHWSRKGACLAYNALMEKLGREGDLVTVEPTAVREAGGDLSRMLYSFYGPQEVNYRYDIARQYTLTSANDSVEDGWITTENDMGKGTLLMFRDSFADTLIPFLSNAYAKAYYSKGLPNALERYVETCAPDTVVIEKVERNLRDYLEEPPILTPPEAEPPMKFSIAETESEISIESAYNDPSYWLMTGSVDPTRFPMEAEIFLEVDGRFLRAFQTGENNFLLYLKKEDFPGETLSVRLYADSPTGCVQLLSRELTLPQ